MIGNPPNQAEYIGCLTYKCRLLKTKKEICCLSLDKLCEHNSKSGKSVNTDWHNKCIIIAAESASYDLLSLIVPLRGIFQEVNKIKPIVLLLRDR